MYQSEYLKGLVLHLTGELGKDWAGAARQALGKALGACLGAQAQGGCGVRGTLFPGQLSGFFFQFRKVEKPGEAPSPFQPALPSP